MITPVTPQHGDLLAAIHAHAFPPGDSWDAASLEALLKLPRALGLMDDRGGFVLAQAAAGEAELLTIAVEPQQRRKGIARALLLALIDCMPGTLFLEVATDNPAACALYRGLGWREVGRRLGYYGGTRDALILRRDA